MVNTCKGTNSGSRLGGRIRLLLIFIILLLILAPFVQAWVFAKPIPEAYRDAAGNALTAAIIFVVLFLINWLFRSPKAYGEHFRQHRSIPPEDRLSCAKQLDSGKSYSIFLAYGIEGDDPVFSIEEVLKMAGWRSSLISGCMDTSKSSTVGVIFESSDLRILDQCRKVFSPYIPDAEFRRENVSENLWLTIGHKHSDKP